MRSNLLNLGFGQFPPKSAGFNAVAPSTALIDRSLTTSLRAKSATLRPARQQLVDALQSVPVGELDQGFDAGTGALTRKNSERGEHELCVR